MELLNFEENIIIIDYSGYISFDIGISNMNFIENKLKELSLSNNCLKIIFDVRNTQWESIETHNELSKIARRIFNSQSLNCDIFTAILNREINDSTIYNERWFVRKQDALKWLRSVQ